MSNADLALLARVGVGFALAYLLGFERQLRGAPAGNRTFALVGATSAAVTAVAARTSPQAVAGVVTGVGFIGGGVVFHSEGGYVRGITTAATIFAAAAIGVVVGYGHLVLGVITGLGVLITLEIPHLPGLRVLDARRLIGRFESDPSYVDGEEVSSSGHPAEPR
jgi:putative Mg2+ transporter-C (MgtC) family protein